MIIKNKQNNIIHYHSIKIGSNDYLIDRFLEIFPFSMAIFIFLLPLLLSFRYPILVASFIITYDILWLFRAFGYALHLINGYRLLKKAISYNWQEECKKVNNKNSYLEELKKEKTEIEKNYPLIKIPVFNILINFKDRKLSYKKIKEKINFLQYLIKNNIKVKDYHKIYHLVILPTYKEPIEVLEDSVKSLINTYPKEKIFFVLATEERDKKQALKNAKILEQKFAKYFGLFAHIMHPDNLPGEVRGKGANITYAAKKILKVIKKKKITPEDIIVTTLDADTCIHPQYFWRLTYEYIINPERIHCSFQPIPIYSNNIWDVPPPITIISISCSFWQIIQSSRAHLLRNFSVHAQSLKTLLDTNFWSVKTVVEDGHQFWRTFMHYNGYHKVIPLFIPVYQDAVLGKNFWQTAKKQYLQLRRWAWGVTDFPYVIKNFIINKKISWWQKILESWHAFEAPFSQATAPLIITFVAWMPIFLNPRFSRSDVLALNLPKVCSGLLTISMVGLMVSAIISTLLIPKPPAKTYYRQKNKFILILEWVFVPAISIFFSSLPALDAQFKLARGHYMEIPGFFVVEKIRKK